MSNGRKVCVLLVIVMVAVFWPIRAFGDDMPQEAEKVIYLTFDDGPSIYTPQLLRLLDRYGAKATFFLVDTGCCDEELLRDMADGGHSIGIHSLSHDFKTIYSSDEAFMEDIYAMQELIRQKAGYTTFLMRFPGGSSNTVSRRYSKGIMSRLTAAVEEAGFRYFDWNVDSQDAGGAWDKDSVVQNVINGCSYNKISIVLQHDIKGYSVDAVEEIILWGLANGYTVLPLDATSPTFHQRVPGT